MNLLDTDMMEQVQFERLTYINGLDGFQPGPRREYAVIGDPLRLSLGNRSWWDLAHWLGERDIICEISGPYWTYWSSDQIESLFNDWTTLKIAYEALALVRIERAEDTVRFERALLRGFGRPARMGVAQTVTQQEQRQHDGVVRYVRDHLRCHVLRSVGPEPGQHLTQRLPGPHT